MNNDIYVWACTYLWNSMAQIKRTMKIDNFYFLSLVLEFLFIRYMDYILLFKYIY